MSQLIPDHEVEAEGGPLSSPPDARRGSHKKSLIPEHVHVAADNEKNVGFAEEVDERRASVVSTTAKNDKRHSIRPSTDKRYSLREPQPSEEFPKEKTSEQKDAEDILALQEFFKQPTGDQSKDFKKPLRRPKLTHENTYILESKKPFVASRVEEIINSTLEQNLTGLKYCSKTASNTAALLAETIRHRVLHLDYDRYKYIVHVVIGSWARQGFCNAFKHLGDASRDSYAAGTFKSHHIFAVASVHAVYYD